MLQFLFWIFDFVCYQKFKESSKLFFFFLTIFWQFPLSGNEKIFIKDQNSRLLKRGKEVISGELVKKQPEVDALKITLKLGRRKRRNSFEKGQKHFHGAFKAAQKQRKKNSSKENKKQTLQ